MGEFSWNMGEYSWGAGGVMWYKLVGGIRRFRVFAGEFPMALAKSAEKLKLFGDRVDIMR